MKVDTHTLEDALVNYFDLSYPVLIATFRCVEAHGMYSGIVPHGMIPDRLRVLRARPIYVERPGWASHVIMLDVQDEWQMTKTLFHELTHAQQAEQCLTVPYFDHTQVQADLLALNATRKYGTKYQSNATTMEREANEVSQKLTNELGLIFT